VPSVTSSVLALLAATTIAAGQGTRPVGGCLDDDLAAKLPRIRQLMLEGIAQTTPAAMTVVRTLSRKSPSLFAGSYDRHSNIAARWGLLSWARRAGDDEARRAILDSLRLPALKDERAFIEEFGKLSEVTPYDDAWLVLLWRELAAAADDEEVAGFARTLAREAEERVFEYVTARPPPKPASESQPESAPASRARRLRIRRSSPWTSGAYDSAAWALVALQSGPCAQQDASSILGRLRRERIPAARAAFSDASRRRDSDFLWTPALYALSDMIPPVTAAVAPYEPPPWEPPPKNITLDNCHRLGREIVKLWPVALHAGMGDASARKLLNARLRVCLEREETWDGPFLTVSHWIPQFLAFTIWLADGRP
jgi:hypothetical protein